MSNSDEFLKAINILTNENNKDRVYKTAMEKEIERLLKESKEKNKTIEKQRKHIEALKQKGNRYIEINEKDRIIIYDTKENKFSWKTCWSDLPCNIIDDLYKNELINYYKHNVLKICNFKRMSEQSTWAREFYDTWDDGNSNKCFSFHLLTKVAKVRGLMRNIANKNQINLHASDLGTGYNCIAICKNGNKCKCKGYDSLYDSYDNPNEYNYLYNIKNWSSMFLCSRHARSGSGDDKRFWLRKHLNEHKKAHNQDYNKFSIEERSNLFQSNERKEWEFSYQ